MTRTQPIDAQWATERLHRSDRTPRREGEMNGTHILSGVSVARNAAEDRELTRAARFIVRFGLDDEDRGELLDTFGLTWEQASPMPSGEAGVQPGFKVCTSCRLPKPVGEFSRRKHYARLSYCRACETAGEATP